MFQKLSRTWSLRLTDGLTRRRTSDERRVMMEQPRRTKIVEIREHRRMLMKASRTKAVPTFRDLVELITAVRDIVDGKFQVKQLSDRC